ncbi:MAG TPA: hypothetical protein VL563_00075 [Gemmatimonadales bacterium]|jgi:hypothetical protein|nr:hypothetical protein [Gemmatimonadales bacterium]
MRRAVFSGGKTQGRGPSAAVIDRAFRGRKAKPDRVGSLVEVISMALVRLGASVCAFVTLLSLAGCADKPSVLAPTTTSTLGRDTVAQPAEINPGTVPSGGPTLTLYNSDFRYTDHSGGYSTDPERWVEIEVVAGEPVAVSWFGRFRGGAKLHAYRWTLDILDVSDETPRINEATDLSHWSQPSASTTSATVGPFAPGEQHLFYVEVTDTNGFRSLATVHMTVVNVVTEEVRSR